MTQRTVVRRLIGRDLPHRRHAGRRCFLRIGAKQLTAVPLRPGYPPGVRSTRSLPRLPVPRRVRLEFGEAPRFAPITASFLREDCALIVPLRLHACDASSRELTHQQRSHPSIRLDLRDWVPGSGAGAAALVKLICKLRPQIICYPDSVGAVDRTHLSLAHSSLILRQPWFKIRNTALSLLVFLEAHHTRRHQTAIYTRDDAT